MSYRFECGEAVAEGIRRIAVEQIDQALSDLGALDDDPDEAIHEARKCFKKVRAVLRLVRDEIGRDVYKPENVRYRDAGRRLSAVRDSFVRVETLDDLVEYFDDQLVEGAFDEIRSGLVRAHQDVRHRIVQQEQAVDEVIAAVRVGRDRVTEWPIETNSFQAMHDGLKRVYKRGRNALEDARAEPTVENWHELRKRVKYLWYHMRILGPSWPDVLEELADALHDLSDDLGADHDLAVLGRFLQEGSSVHVSDASELEALLALIDERREQLQEAARPLGQRIYVEKPKDFVHRMDEYWEVWHS